MTAETRARDTICLLAKSLFDQGLTFGATVTPWIRRKQVDTWTLTDPAAPA
jgi:hypothetical protein